MSLSRANVEIFNQKHQMYAEGSEDFLITESDIKDFLNNEGYVVSNIDIFYDNLQSVHRWTADIMKTNT